MPRQIANLARLLPLLPALCAVLLAGHTTSAQQLRVFMSRDGDQASQPSGNHTNMDMLPGEPATVAVFIEDTTAGPTPLNTYQLIFHYEADSLSCLPAGTIEYVDNNPGQPGGDSIFLDSGRADWVFAGMFEVSTSYNESPGIGIFGLLYSTFPVASVNTAGLGIRYLAELQLTASGDACGPFDYPFNIAPDPPPLSELFAPLGAPLTVDAWQALRINLPACPDSCPEPCLDCNLNGVADACDILLGTSLDLDMNTVPDECVNFVGLCSGDDAELWSCTNNWQPIGPDEYPDNSAFGGPFNVTLDNSDDVLLDVPVVINTLQLYDQAILRVTQPSGPGPSSAAMTVTDDGGVLIQGTVEVAEDNVINVTGGATVGAGGLYRRAQGATGVTAVLSSGRLTMLGAPPGTPPATVTLDQAMSLNSGGNFVLGDPGSCTPPDLIVAGAAAVQVGGSFVIDGAGGIDYASTRPLQLMGDFANSSGAPEIFNWIDGAILLDGTAALSGGLQTFEAAGDDVGPEPAGFDASFALGTLIVGNNAQVHFADLFDNNGDANPKPCNEALYVKNLVLGRSCTVTLDNVKVYYLDAAIDRSSAIIELGCGQLLPVAPDGPSDCFDVDGDGFRDGSCTWWDYSPGVCIGQSIVFADMGGPFGACPPDGAADGNDRFHALNCFSDKSTTGANGYPCEASPPVAFNVDAGGQFSSCAPDGVCDANDAFHALNAFSNLTSCRCPMESGPAPHFTPPGTPAARSSVESAAIELVASTQRVRPGSLLEVDVHLASALTDLRGYQLHLGARGGSAGSLELVDIFVGEEGVLSRDQGPKGRQGQQGQQGRSDFDAWRSTRTAPHERRATLRQAQGTTSDERQLLTAAPVLGPRPSTIGSSYWSAFNIGTHQMLAGLDGPGIAVPAGSYLATFVYRATKDARGTFTVELLADSANPAQRTFLFPTPAGSRIDVASAPDVRIEIVRLHTP